MAEKEQDRRLKREDDLINLSKKSLFLTQLGLVLGFLSVIVMAGLCAYIAFLGDTKAATAMAGVVIIGLAAVFVTRRFTQQTKEIKDNSKD
jgi:cytochrome c biogenesis protein CcdA